MAIGADRLIEIHGYQGSIKRTYLKAFDPFANFVDGDVIRPNNDWNGWENIGTVDVRLKNNMLETQMVHSKGSDIEMRIHIQDQYGNYDVSDLIIPSEPGALLLTQRSLVPKIIDEESFIGSVENSESQISEFLELELISYADDITIDSIKFNCDLENIEILEYNKNEITSTGIDNFNNNNVNIETELPEPGQSSRVEFPIKLEKGEHKILRIKPVDPTIFLDKQNIISLETTDVEIKTGKVTLLGDGVRAYIGSISTKIEIDGLFEDWRDKEMIVDNDNSEISNPDINLSKYSIYNADDSLYFYLNVKGIILSGTELPEEPFLYQPKTVKPKRVEIGTNLKNPLHDLPVMTGEDTIYIFLDTDYQHSTGYRPDDKFKIGAEYMVELTGQNGDIIERNIYKFTGDKQTEFSWDDPGSIEAACSDNELELQLSIGQLMGNLERNDIGVYIHIMDWSGEFDNAVYKFVNKDVDGSYSEGKFKNPNDNGDNDFDPSDPPPTIPEFSDLSLFLVVGFVIALMIIIQRRRW
jgi:hypothetical protein